MKILCEVLLIILLPFPSRQSRSRPEFILASLFFFCHCAYTLTCVGNEHIFLEGMANKVIIVLDSSAYLSGLLAASMKPDLLNFS